MVKKTKMSLQVRRYFQLKKRFHDNFEKACENGLGFNDEFGFPLHLHQDVCIASTEISHASQIVIDNLPEDMTGELILDLGCGSGVYSLVSAYRGANVIACDNDVRAIQLIEKNLTANPDVAGKIHAYQSDLFSNTAVSFPKYDRILANLWFASAKPTEKRQNAEALSCYSQFFLSVRDQLKPNGVACITSSNCADFKATEDAMKTFGITPHKETVTRTHFDGKVTLDWHLYSFDKQGQPAKLNRYN